MTKPKLMLTEADVDAMEAVISRLRRQQGLVPLRYGDTRDGDTVFVRRPAGRLVVVGPHGDDEVSVAPSPGDTPDEAGVFLTFEGETIRLHGDEPERIAVALLDAQAQAREGRPGEAEEQVQGIAAIIREASDILTADAIARRILRAGYRKA